MSQPIYRGKGVINFVHLSERVGGEIDYEINGVRSLLNDELQSEHCERQIGVGPINYIRSYIFTHLFT